jgi:pyridoxamine 5'-phosphate oxidase
MWWRTPSSSEPTPNVATDGGATGDLARMRREYMHAALDERQVAIDPIAQFRAWLNEAIAAALPEATAMTLATADRHGQPSARVVLLKGFDDRGFVFYTNYESRKAQDLAANPQAALVFYWSALDRQVRIEGTVEKTSAEDSRRYFASRPLGAQLSAWASPQSAPLASREALELRVAEIGTRFAEGPVPLPPSWGGYRVRPDAIEFWQGRTDRLHDRVHYRRLPAGSERLWQIERLAP